MSIIESPYHTAIADKLSQSLAATHVSMEDYSHLHAGHAQNTGHHLIITIVSPQFDGLNLLQRHRVVHKALAEEMATTIHALELKLFSPAEWTQ